MFSFTVDEAFNRAHNEYAKDVKRLQISSAALGISLALIAAACWFFAPGAGWAIIVVIALGFFALFCLALVFILPKQVGNAQKLYDAYPLVPAIVAEVNPRDVVLMALVNLTVDPAAAPRPALALRTVTKLPGHKRIVGEHVPAVAVSGRRSLKNEGFWDEVSPMPIAWATPDQAVIKEAEDAVRPDQWRLLDKSLNKLAEVKKTPMNLLQL